MKMYLARTAPWKAEGLYDDAIIKHKPFILESFFYADDDTERLLPYYGDFLLDSGAFTFMHSTKDGQKIQWEDYIEKFADFINRNKVEKYFELDIDSIVGYIPNGKVIGLSKVARIADMCAKRLQLQEKIGTDIYDVLRRIINTDDIIVVIEGSHSCMTARGIKKSDSRTKTACCKGKFLDNATLRQEFYSLIGR